MGRIAAYVAVATLFLIMVGTPAFAIDIIVVTAAMWNAEDGSEQEATGFIKEVCDGQEVCDIGRVPLSAVVGDPSPGAPKHLDVKFDCFGSGGIESHSMTFYEVLGVGAVDVAFSCTAL